MESFGKVSVIMPSYNSASFIKESIQSVLDQTYSDWELIIDDGGSKDGTTEIIKSYRDPRIIFLQDCENKGCAFSRNQAMQRAEGEWVALLDSDDVWAQDKLEKQLSFMSTNKLVFSYTNYVEIDELSHPIGVLVTGPKKITRRKMRHYAYPGCLTVIYSQKFFGKMGVDERLANGRNDDALFLQLSEKAPCYLLPETLAFYRVHRGSRSHISKMTNLMYQYNLYRFQYNNCKILSWVKALINAFYYVMVKKPFFRKRYNIKVEK